MTSLVQPPRKGGSIGTVTPEPSPPVTRPTFAWLRGSHCGAGCMPTSRRSNNPDNAAPWFGYNVGSCRFGRRQCLPDGLDHAKGYRDSLASPKPASEAPGRRNGHSSPGRHLLADSGSTSPTTASPTCQSRQGRGRTTRNVAQVACHDHSPTYGRQWARLRFAPRPRTGGAAARPGQSWPELAEALRLPACQALLPFGFPKRPEATSPTSTASRRAPIVAGRVDHRKFSGTSTYISVSPKYPTATPTFAGRAAGVLPVLCRCHSTVWRTVSDPTCRCSAIQPSPTSDTYRSELVGPVPMGAVRSSHSPSVASLTRAHPPRPWPPPGAVNQ